MPDMSGGTVAEAPASGNRSVAVDSASTFGFSGTSSSRITGAFTEAFFCDNRPEHPPKDTTRNRHRANAEQFRAMRNPFLRTYCMQAAVISSISRLNRSDVREANGLASRRASSLCRKRKPESHSQFVRCTVLCLPPRNGTRGPEYFLGEAGCGPSP